MKKKFDISPDACPPPCLALQQKTADRVVIGPDAVSTWLEIMLHYFEMCQNIRYSEEEIKVCMFYKARPGQNIKARAGTNCNHVKTFINLSEPFLILCSHLY